MAAAGQVFTQLNIAHVENALGAVAQADLHLPLQGDDVLTPGRGVKIHQLGGLQAAELDADGFLQLCPQGVAHLLKRQLHILNMGLAVLTRINPDNLHLLVPPGVVCMGRMIAPMEVGLDGVCQRRQERVMIGRYAIVIMTNRLLVVLIVAAEQNNDGIAAAHKVPKVPSTHSCLPLRRRIQHAVLENRVLAGCAKVPPGWVPVCINASGAGGRLQRSGTLTGVAAGTCRLPGRLDIPIAGGDCAVVGTCQSTHVFIS